LRIYRIVIVFFCLNFSGCYGPENKGKERVLKKAVFVIPFPSDSPEEKATELPDTSYLDMLFRSRGLVNIHDLDSTFKVNLSYADTSNFLGIGFYDGLKKAYLRCEAAIQLCNAQYYLKQLNPDYSLLILDASRPLHIQQMMWDSLDMEPLRKYQYLSPPSEPSLHNYGCAVDVSIFDNNTNKMLEMGSEHDQFDKLSEPASEAFLLKTGELSRQAYENRLLLRKVMSRAGYKPINTEWWHFSICTKPEAMKRFEIIP
jgi:zinc D-Ala-D-Ala dipeptidase